MRIALLAVFTLVFGLGFLIEDTPAQAAPGYCKDGVCYPATPTRAREIVTARNFEDATPASYVVVHSDAVQVQYAAPSTVYYSHSQPAYYASDNRVFRPEAPFMQRGPVRRLVALPVRIVTAPFRWAFGRCCG